MLLSKVHGIIWRLQEVSYSKYRLISISVYSTDLHVWEAPEHAIKNEHFIQKSHVK